MKSTIPQYERYYANHNCFSELTSSANKIVHHNSKIDEFSHGDYHYFKQQGQQYRFKMRNIQEELARLMYDKYCASVGGKAFNGDDLPKSEEFFNDETKQKQANAWRDSALIAIEFIKSLTD